MIIDVHAHLDFLDESKIVEIEKDRDVNLVVSNSVNLESNRKNLELSKKYSKVKFGCGMYPDEKVLESEFDDFEKFVEENKKEIFAVGEIGMDFKEGKDRELQERFFRRQLEIAKELEVPAIIHTRKAEEEIVEVLRDYDCFRILHCFSGKLKLVKEAVEIGCYFSIPTNIVRSEHFQKMVEMIPKEKILTETDSPYLSPCKDKKNEPKFIKESIKVISKIWKKSIKETEKQIEENFNRIFK
ncbi:MAG: TatD family hydrolase [Candidatus Pacearchaeota archaeon]|nr:TatD family hydrolase [Candidatus Pacearchaeota archaeon]